MPYILLMLIVFNSCSCSNRKTAIKAQDNKALLEKTMKDNEVDSTKLIDSIYADKIIMNEVDVDSFVCIPHFDSISNKVTITCGAEVKGNAFGYVLDLTDTAKLYSKETFEPSDEYRYDESYLFLNGKKVSITKDRYLNDSTSTIDPVKVWTGFTPVAKYFKLDDRDVFLIRGSNFYCNGHYCTNYKVLIIQKFKNQQISVGCIDYTGNYPFSFANTFLFRSSSSSSPQIYMIRKGTDGTKTSDFDIFRL